MHVLVVDDDVVSAEFLANTLVHFGYEVTVATNGREAFHLVRSGKYSMVISDWEMPEMNGPELCRQIRCRQWSGYIFFMDCEGHQKDPKIKRTLEDLEAMAVRLEVLGSYPRSEPVD